MREVCAEDGIKYGSDDQAVMVDQCLWVMFQSHRVMGGFLRSQVCHYNGVYLHITFYLLEYQAPRCEGVAPRQKMEAQAKSIRANKKYLK